MIDLAAETERLLAFAEGSRHPDGGFAWLRSDGTPDLDAPARAVDHDADDARVRARRAARRPGAAELVAHGLDALRQRTSATPVHGGWFAQAGGSDDKRAYEHVFVVLAAAAAGDDELLGEALEVLDDALLGRGRRRAGATSATATGPSSRPTAAPTRTCTASRRCSPPATRCGASGRCGSRSGWSSATIRGWSSTSTRLAPAAGLQPRRSRAPVPALRRDARALVRVGAAGVHARRSRFEADARRLFAARVARRLGRQRVRLHRRLGRPAGRAPTGCTGCCARRSRAAAVLGEDGAAARSGGSSPSALHRPRAAARWRHELDPSNRPACTVWDGKPDVYHALQATLDPALCAAAALTSALAGDALRRRARRPRIGGGVIAAAVITSANAARRTSSAQRVLGQRLLEHERAGGDRQHVGGRAREGDHRHGRAELQRAGGDEQADQDSAQDHERERVDDTPTPSPRPCR